MAAAEGVPADKRSDPARSRPDGPPGPARPLNRPPGPAQNPDRLGWERPNPERPGMTCVGATLWPTLRRHSDGIGPYRDGTCLGSTFCTVGGPNSRPEGLPSAITWLARKSFILAADTALDLGRGVTHATGSGPPGRDRTAQVRDRPPRLSWSPVRGDGPDPGRPDRDVRLGRPAAAPPAATRHPVRRAGSRSGTLPGTRPRPA